VLTSFIKSININELYFSVYVPYPSRARHLFCIKFLFYKDLSLNLTQLGYHLQYHFDNVGVSLEVRI
jgi:hypothetical protein